jgi:HEAT repeat protein
MLCTNQAEEVRALCAVLLRKSVMACATQAQGSLISLLSPAVGQALKSHLLACIQSEPKKHIRKKVCDAVGQLGINLLNADQQNGWPELLPFMLQGTRSGDANMHEASLTIFNALADFMCEKMVPYHATLLEVFRGSLQTDQPMAVRIAGLKGLASFLLALQSADTRNHFQELVPLMLQAIAQALTSGEEESCRSALEVFVEIAESQPKFLKRHLHEAVNGMVAIASNTSLEDATRHLALEFLLTVAENMTSAAKKLDRFCETTVPVALSMMLEIDMNTAEELAEWEEREEDDEDEEITNYDVGEEAIDRLAIALGGKLMVPVLFEKIQQLIKSPDWKHRHAALMSISQSGEGCEMAMKANLQQIVTMIVGHFRDEHPRVRWAAINTVGQMCTDFGPDLQEELHELVLPALIATMDDGCKRVQAHAAAAVINFCEHCSKPTLKRYLPDLLGKLMVLLQRNVRRVTEQAVTAIASVADVAEEDFAPYYGSFMPGLKQILQLAGGKQFRMLRGKAMECISLIGVAVGDAAFEPDAKEVMDLIIQTQQTEALDPDDPQIQFMLQACGRICKCLGEKFSPYLPYVIPPLLRSALVDPELHVTDADDEDEVEAEEGMESVTVAIRGQGNKRITIRTSALEEKATACHMLRTYALELKDAFFPHVADVARVLVPLIGFQYMDEVRVNACHAMPDLLDSAILALQKGAPSATPDVVHQLKGYLYKAVIDQLHKEPDTETLAELLTAWCEIIKHGEECDAAKLTPEELQQSFEVVKELVVEVIERRDERSKAAGDEEGDDEEEDAREADAINDENLISTLVECLGTLFKVYGSPLLPLFQAQLQPIVQAMLQPTAAEPDRVAALCVFDDIIEHCSADGGATEYARTLLPAYLQYARDPKPEVRQAAVYGLGVLAACDNGAAFGAAQQQQAAQVLIEVFEAEQAFDEDNASASDNAVSALGKLCARTPEIGAVGWPRWLNVLPIRADKEEAWKVHQQLVQLVEASNTAVMGASMERLPDIICVFGEILGTDLIEPGLELRITHLLKQVRDGLPQVLSALPSHPRFARLKPNQRTQLERALSS